MKKLEKHLPFRGEVAQAAVVTTLAGNGDKCSLVVLKERIGFLWPDFEETELVCAIYCLAGLGLLSTLGDLAKPHDFFLHLTK